MVSEPLFWEDALEFREEDLDFLEETMLGAVSGVWTEEALDCFEEIVRLDATVVSSLGFFEDATVPCVLTERSSLTGSSLVGFSVTKKSL